MGYTMLWYAFWWRLLMRCLSKELCRETYGEWIGFVWRFGKHGIRCCHVAAVLLVFHVQEGSCIAHAECGAIHVRHTRGFG